MRKPLIFTMVFMFIMSQAAFAQWGKDQQMQRFQGEFKPVVGAWAEYQIKGSDQGPTKMKIAIVGKEGNAFWYETINDGQGGRNIMKMLLSGDPNDQKGVTRMIMKNGNEQAIEMPITGMGQGKKPAKAQPPKGKVIDKGMETITVPAGTFTARHLQYLERKRCGGYMVQREGTALQHGQDIGKRLYYGSCRVRHRRQDRHHGDTQKIPDAQDACRHAARDDASGNGWPGERVAL